MGRPLSKPAPDDLQAQVRVLIKRVGVDRAAQEVGLSIETISRLAAGGTVHPGTVAMAQNWASSKGRKA